MDFMRRLFYFLSFTALLILGILINRAGRPREVFRLVCDLTAENFYRSDARLDRWVRDCRRKALALPAFASVELLMAELQDHMNEMNVSHFSIYNPVEDRKIWKGEAVDTGIRARYVEAHLLVYKVFEGSAAAEAGVRPGDEIVALPGTDQVTPYGAQNRTGLFTLQRGGRKLKIEIRPKALVVDSSPRLVSLGGGQGLLEISSFRSEFFPVSEWQQMAKKLSGYQSLIVDIRENSGGNFVAMLRALSTFMCSPQKIGDLVQPRKARKEKYEFADNTSDAYQIEELAKYSRIGLRTFHDYGCFRGRVTVLVGPDTASVAEIFAQGFSYRPHSRVWGQPTAGDVVLAVWYDLPSLGKGYSVSIPEAVYLNLKREQLEAHGVYPSRELYHDLQISRSGKDTWILEALKP